MPWQIQITGNLRQTKMTKETGKRVKELKRQTNEAETDKKRKPRKKGGWQRVSKSERGIDGK